MMKPLRRFVMAVLVFNVAGVAEVESQAAPRAGIFALQSMLGDKSAQIRIKAAEGLGRVGGRKAVLILRRGLNDKDTGVRIAVIEALGFVGGRVAITVLSEALKDKMPEVRKRAVEALKDAGTVSGIPIIQKAFGDKEEEVRLHAALMLRKIGHRNGVHVTITNATANQIFSPPVVVSHGQGVSLWSVGQPASAELAAIAEDADATGLLALLEGTAGVRDFAIAGNVLLPGESVTLSVARSGRLTVLGMLVTTNDVFFGLGSQKLRGGRGTFNANAYDAGSEKNTQRCSDIPGPPCGNPGVRVTAGAEGFVHISPGINRSGRLRPSFQGWANPVARISVQ